MASEEQLSRLQAVVAAAQACARKWGVPSSVTLAQWIFESSWGTSQLALRGNNFFGVKYSQLRGNADYVEMPTAEYEAGRRVIVLAAFVKYPTAQDSFDDHGALLATSSRYAPAMAVKSNPTAFATQLKRCGYSTDPEYGNKLLCVIRQYGLAQYEIAPEPVVREPPAKAAFDKAVDSSGLV
jgi:flagellum-specific peptidoglycan hydrolase FlgJ